MHQGKRIDLRIRKIAMKNLDLFLYILLVIGHFSNAIEDNEVIAQKTKVSDTSKLSIDVSKILLHLHEIVEGLYFYLSLPVCLFVNVCVCVCVSVNKVPANLNAVFAKWLLIALAQIISKSVTLLQQPQSVFEGPHFCRFLTSFILSCVGALSSIITGHRGLLVFEE